MILYLVKLSTIDMMTDTITKPIRITVIGVLSSYCAIINSAKRCLQNLQASTIMHLFFIYLPNIHLTVRLHNLQPLSDLHQRLSLRS